MPNYIHHVRITLSTLLVTLSAASAICAFIYSFRFLAPKDPTKKLTLETQHSQQARSWFSVEAEDEERGLSDIEFYCAMMCFALAMIIPRPLLRRLLPREKAVSRARVRWWLMSSIVAMLSLDLWMMVKGLDCAVKLPKPMAKEYFSSGWWWIDQLACIVETLNFVILGAVLSAEVYLDPEWGVEEGEEERVGVGAVELSKEKVADCTDLPNEKAVGETKVLQS